MGRTSHCTGLQTSYRLKKDVPLFALTIPGSLNSRRPTMRCTTSLSTRNPCRTASSLLKRVQKKSIRISVLSCTSEADDASSETEDDVMLERSRSEYAAVLEAANVPLKSSLGELPKRAKRIESRRIGSFLQSKPR